MGWRHPSDDDMRIASSRGNDTYRHFRGRVHRARDTTEYCARRIHEDIVPVFVRSRDGDRTWIGAFASVAHVRQSWTVLQYAFEPFVVVALALGRGHVEGWRMFFSVRGEEDGHEGIEYVLWSHRNGDSFR